MKLINIPYIILELFAKHMNSTHPEVVEKDWVKCSQCPLKFPTAYGKKIHTTRFVLISILKATKTKFKDKK